MNGITCACRYIVWIFRFFIGAWTTVLQSIEFSLPALLFLEHLKMTLFFFKIFRQFSWAYLSWDFKLLFNVIHIIAHFMCDVSFGWYSLKIDWNELVWFFLIKWGNEINIICKNSMEIICGTQAELGKLEIGEQKWNKQKTQFKWKTFHLETMSGYVNQILISWANYSTHEMILWNANFVEKI